MSDSPQADASIDNRRTWLERATQISRTMVTAAESGDWERVQALAAERKPLVTDAFAGELSAEARDALASSLRRLAHLNDQLIELAAVARDERAEQIQQVRGGRRAASAYASCAGTA